MDFSDLISANHSRNIFSCSGIPYLSSNHSGSYTDAPTSPAEISLDGLLGSYIRQPFSEYLFLLGNSVLIQQPFRVIQICTYESSRNFLRWTSRILYPPTILGISFPAREFRTYPATIPGHTDMHLRVQPKFP